MSLFQTYVETVLELWSEFPNDPRGTKGEYVFHQPELSDEQRTATLPITGEWTIGSRPAFEDAASHLLRTFMPFEFALHLEEGLTESATGELRTSWRKAFQAVRHDPQSAGE